MTLITSRCFITRQHIKCTCQITINDKYFERSPFYSHYSLKNGDSVQTFQTRHKIPYVKITWSCRSVYTFTTSSDEFLGWLPEGRRRRMLRLFLAFSTTPLYQTHYHNSNGPKLLAQIYSDCKDDQ